MDLSIDEGDADPADSGSVEHPVYTVEDGSVLCGAVTAAAESAAAVGPVDRKTYLR